MPLNYKLLKKCGTDEERLKKLFTANPKLCPDTATEEEKEEARKDWEMRCRIEELIASRIDESILNNLKAAHLYQAVDLAWDSSTITRKTVPLVMYAQRRISLCDAITALDDISCKEQYIKRDATGKPVDIDLPKFTEVNVNVVRSVITRRTAAQSARFTNLYPFFKFETRGTSEEDKLRGDLLSQRIDIMADQFGFRVAQIGWIRDMLLYPHVMAFPAAKWEREVEWDFEGANIAEEFKPEDNGEPKKINRVKREGVPIVTPHPSRTFHDINYPITSINSDTGCEWFGFWDVTRYVALEQNCEYWNQHEIGYGEGTKSIFDNYSSYFSQYYTTINHPPIETTGAAVVGENDRKVQLGRFTSAMRDASLFLTHFYWKVKPNQWGMGDYPHPVWLHLTVANSRTVVHAEIMPDTPGFVFSHNASSHRLVNLSMAHELMPFQDQLTNLYTELLECVKRDLFGIAILNLDAFPADNAEAQAALKGFRQAMDGGNFLSAVHKLECSLIKMKELGVDLDSVFKIVRQDASRQISEIIQAIAQTIGLAERVMAMSPQEQAQPSPRETSATEIQVLAGTTENVYQFISDSIDEGRAALKRYLYNALMSCGTEEIKLPAISRYPKSVIEKAGLKIEDEEFVRGADPESPRLYTVKGRKEDLIAEYIFNSRDGADRASNIQAAQTLTQMLGVLMQPAIMAMLTRDQFASIINAIIRQSGAGLDIVIEPQPGEGQTPVQLPGSPEGVSPVDVGEVVPVTDPARTTPGRRVTPTLA